MTKSKGFERIPHYNLCVGAVNSFKCWSSDKNVKYRPVTPREDEAKGLVSLDDEDDFDDDAEEK